MIELNSNICFGDVQIIDFFKFGNETGDSILTKHNSINASFGTLPIAIPFLNRSETSLFIFVDGFLTFNDVRSKIIIGNEKCKPLWEGQRMIAVYWADIITKYCNECDIFYRATSEESLLQKAEQEISGKFAKLSSFKPKWLFIATWYHVPYLGAKDCKDDKNTIKGPPYPNNTFQATIATDGLRTFAIFYYNSIVWTAGDADGGNRCTGLGENGDGFIGANVRFDAGDNKTYYQVNGSCTTEILNISHTSNVGSPGKWIFRIDQASSDQEQYLPLNKKGIFMLLQSNRYTSFVSIQHFQVHVLIGMRIC